MAAVPGGAAVDAVLQPGTLMQFKLARRLRPQDDGVER